MKNNRRLILINKPFQIKFFIWFFVGISLINMVLYFINLYFFNSFTIIGLQPGTVDNSAYFDLINSQKEKMDAVFAVTYLFEIIVLMIFSYIFSHRIAGPIHRMKMWLIAIAQGENVPDLNFRKDDFFAELPELANKAFQTSKRDRH